MTMRSIQGVFIADTARVLGEVILGQDVSVWYGVTIRGDVAPITVGDGSNVQDNAVLHCDHKFPLVIGSGVTIGHAAVVHGESVGDGTMIGIGAIVLGHAKIGRHCLIAAGAVVPPGLVVPDNMVVMGVPGRAIRETTDAEKEYLRTIPPRYVELARRHHEHPGEPISRPYGGI